MTISSFVCLVQIGLLVAMIQDDGYVSKSENPMYGPSAYTLVRYGAKVAALIKYEGEWWRLITPIFLHAGIIHIISNVAIQLRVGGYLELVFGRARWVFIYLSSGIYGNMLSCIFLPDSVGIGSSGAVLGMLTAWIVWILFRWSKVPAESRGQRTCQLIVVTAAVAFTLAFSFTDYGERCHAMPCISTIFCLLWDCACCAHWCCHGLCPHPFSVFCMCLALGQWTGRRTLGEPFREPSRPP